MLATKSIDDLIDAADGYFRSVLAAPDPLLAKPLATASEAVEVLSNFAQVLALLEAAPGDRVLDFGVGSCWTSRFLVQLGYEVVAVDVSSAALELGRQLFSRLPVIGPRPAPTFLLFDGHRFLLDDVSVDRIVVVDSFHHVPNPEVVLAEMGRVLRNGGRAVFHESGPNHSRSPSRRLR